MAKIHESTKVALRLGPIWNGDRTTLPHQHPAACIMMSKHTSILCINLSMASCAPSEMDNGLKWRHTHTNNGRWRVQEMDYTNCHSSTQRLIQQFLFLFHFIFSIEFNRNDPSSCALSAHPFIRSDRIRIERKDGRGDKKDQVKWRASHCDESSGYVAPIKWVSANNLWHTTIRIRKMPFEIGK